MSVQNVDSSKCRHPDLSTLQDVDTWITDRFKTAARDFRSLRTGRHCNSGFILVAKCQWTKMSTFRNVDKFINRRRSPSGTKGRKPLAAALTYRIFKYRHFGASTYRDVYILSYRHFALSTFRTGTLEYYSWFSLRSIWLIFC